MARAMLQARGCPPHDKESVGLLPPPEMIGNSPTTRGVYSNVGPFVECHWAAHKI